MSDLQAQVRRIPWIVRMIYPLRIFGCAIAMFGLIAVLYDRPTQPQLWVFIVTFSVAWPHLAYWISRNSADQKAAEMRNLLVDAFVIGGVWPAAMSFSVLPTLLMLGGVTFDNVSTGGVRLALRGLAASVAGAAICSAILGFQFIPDTNLIATLVSAVCILAFNGAVGFQSYRVSRHYVEAKRSVEQKAKELERAVAEREQARQEAEAASRAKSQFLASMSHELRTPMNAIIGFTDLLIRDDRDPRHAEQLRHIDSASRSLLALINQILDLSKIEAGRLELEQQAFAVTPLLDKLEALFRSQAAARDLTLKFSYPADLPAVVTGDALRLEQVLMNLVGNALKFTHQGTVELSVSRRTAGSGQVMLEFGVKDSGIGISEEQQARLFIPFAQADQSTTRKYGGTGLGLVISKQLIELMGGTLTVNSRLGQGSEFRFSLPFALACDADPATTAVVRAPLGNLDAAAKVRGLRVLLAEDNAMNRRLAGAILGDAGVVLDFAEDGRQALAAAQAKPYDLVLMDMQMPEMDGLDATRAIRALPGHDKLPIIAMTASAMEQDREQCLSSGMNDFLTKPIDAEQLLAMLDKWRKPIGEESHERQ